MYFRSFTYVHLRRAPGSHISSGRESGAAATAGNLHAQPTTGERMSRESTYAALVRSSLYLDIVQFDGESYRLREGKEQAAKRSTAYSPRSAKSRASSMGDIPPPKACPI